MTPERWAAVEGRLQALMEVDPADRMAGLAELERQDPDLAAEVRDLLIAADDAPQFGPEGGSDLFAEFVGPYRLLSCLGGGGMGTVYLAVREEAGFPQRVALKLLRPGMGFTHLAQQMVNERQVLARLEHPHIAKLIDGGTTASGQQYLAMEYVAGSTLLEHANERNLPIDDRLRLFAAVCRAVHYAHQQLVIHRDLKPSNIMVDSEGRPRLLDFGIAKVLDPERPDGTTITSPWLTPAYASPEQVRGGAINTLSDQYSLGVILYQLLAGARPYEVEGVPPAQLALLICEREPPKPSEAALDRRIGRLLEGDLDTIVLKAMAKEPSRRYGSVAQLADDLERYLDGNPVMARRDSFRYRLGKAVRRNRAAVTAAVVVLFSAAGGVGVAFRQAAIARRERDRAEEARAQSADVTRFLIGLFDVADPLAQGADTAVTRALLRQGLAQAEALASRPLVQASMFDALGMVFINLGHYGEGFDLIYRGYDLRVLRLPADHPDIANSLSNLGEALRGMSRYPDALGRHEAALAIRLRIEGPEGAGVAASYRDLGFLMPYLGRNDESLRYYEAALAIDRKARGPDDEATILDVTMVGQALRRLGRYDEALVRLEDAVARLERTVGPDDPEIAGTRFHLGDLLIVMGRPDDAIAQLRRGVRARRQAFGDQDLGQIHGLEALAGIAAARNDGAEAERLLREALEIRRVRVGEGAILYASSLELLGDELARQRRFPEAIALRRRALATWRQAVGGEHAGVAGSLVALARVLVDAGKPADAEPVVREALSLRQRLNGPDHALTGLAHYRLGTVLAALGRLDDAERAFLDAERILSVTHPAGHPELAELHLAQADLYERLGRPGEALRHRTLASTGTGGPSRLASPADRAAGPEVR